MDIKIYDWMVIELKLKGNDLIVYAAIYEYTKMHGCFDGSRQVLMEWCNCSPRGIDKNLKNLLDNNLIIKEYFYVKNIKCCKYRPNLKRIPDKAKEEK